jgi:hypothetical protein
LQVKMMQCMVGGQHHAMIHFATLIKMFTLGLCRSTHKKNPKNHEKQTNPKVKVNWSLGLDIYLYSSTY